MPYSSESMLADLLADPRATATLTRDAPTIADPLAREPLPPDFVRILTPALLDELVQAMGMPALIAAGVTRDRIVIVAKREDVITATTLPFRPAVERGISAELVGAMLRDSFTVPARDEELSILVMTGEQLLRSYDNGPADSFVATRAARDATR